jgi:hypothetical protein
VGFFFCLIFSARSGAESRALPQAGKLDGFLSSECGEHATILGTFFRWRATGEQKEGRYARWKT